MTDTPTPWRRWILAARTRTLPAAIVPVAVGASSARPLGLNWVNTALAALVALSLQIGTNYANDYSDGVRGTDEIRVGPFRLTASRLVAARSVRNAAFACFLLAAVLGLALASRTSWWFVPIGASAIAAGWFYTGGPKPYGYFGFGELFVMLYFGFVATVGSAFAQHRHWSAQVWWLAVATGSMACALLEANNIRDIAGDQAAGKKTLAARLGRRQSSWLYALCGAGVSVGSVAGAGPIGFLAIAIYLVGLSKFVITSRSGSEMLPLLQFSARAQLAMGLGLVLSNWFYYSPGSKNLVITCGVALVLSGVWCARAIAGQKG